MIDTYVISLESTPLRLNEFQKNNNFLKFEHFKAVNGKELNKVQLIESHLLSSDCIYNDGALGCAFSHIQLWNMCIQLNKPINVLEDDAIVHPNFNSAVNQAVNVFGFGMVTWGWNFDSEMIIWLNKNLGLTTIRSDQSDMICHIDGFLNSDINPHFFDLFSAYGSVAYTITPHVASILLKNNLPLGNRKLLVPRLGYLDNYGIDMALSVDYAEVNSKVSIPPMVLTKNDKTNNTISVG
jgi:GR25 family glycosyltransferase involved in LPS biosynthesis